MDQMGHDLRREALNFTEQLMELYFARRELSALPDFMVEQISWIGTGADELCRNLAEAKNALAQELEEYHGSFTVTQCQLDAVPLSKAHCVVYGVIHAVPEDPIIAEERLRLSIVVEKTEGGIKLIHLHLSHPDQNQEAGHYYIPKAHPCNSRELKRDLALRTQQLNILNRSIPGGVHQCRNDAVFTLLTMSDSFLSMLGYTGEEIERLFHNHFIEMVYPGDRAALIDTVHRQLEQGRDIEVEYRVLCKNGLPVWILDKGRLIQDDSGEENFYSILIEITEREREQEELRLSLERHRVIMDQATDVIFEWDILNDTLSLSPNWHKKFGYEAVNTQISQRIPCATNIHPADMPAFMKLMEDTAAGIPYSETEFRIKDLAGTYYWCRIRATAQFAADGRAIKAVGVIVDIDDEKKQRQALLESAQKDALTGIYNKSTINTLVERRMASGDPAMMQALFILDIDCFKQVNDAYGHLTGDGLLASVAAVIKSQLRATDLAGRIGGDEFLIYLPEVSGEEAARAKAEQLLAALSLLSPTPGALPISCSIGGAVFPHSVMNYYGLYQCADEALYARKNQSRGGVTFYTPDLERRPSSSRMESAVGRIVSWDGAGAR